MSYCYSGYFRERVRRNCSTLPGVSRLILTKERTGSGGKLDVVQKQINPTILNHLKPIGSMYGIFTYIKLIFMVNVGKYTIHGSYGKGAFLCDDDRSVGPKSSYRHRFNRFVRFSAGICVPRKPRAETIYIYYFWFHPCFQGNPSYPPQSYPPPGIRVNKALLRETNG